MCADDDWIISSLLEDLGALALARDRVSVHDLVETIGPRGFGPLLALLAGMLILPTGMIPGVPNVVALFLILIGGRMMTGAQEIWVPDRLGRVSFSGHMLAVSVAKAQRWALWLRPHLMPRLVFLVEGAVARRAIALILLLTGAVMTLVGLIPGFPFVLSLHVVVLGLALSSRDGLAALVGYALILAEILFITAFFL
ncbi:exopolysaccharide biosynthesis protein [Rhodovulum sp.]|uniref:exopolysaccharide biosynthesis protein n=1 Tax=Rhodovulum sp. TaxID=34009 RepID=UPI0017A18244|nr:exopolysaccharide biosynthesis protein [Rhodovulum sp.]HDR27278.1 exopolysaccharide biosynthesis protein [Rhodovulum sp.]